MVSGCETNINMAHIQESGIPLATTNSIAVSRCNGGNAIVPFRWIYGDDVTEVYLTAIVIYTAMHMCNIYTYVFHGMVLNINENVPGIYISMYWIECLLNAVQINFHF